MPFWVYATVAIGGYLLGSLPTGYCVARARGVDIRSVGSGNIGATNAMRVLGRPVGIAVLVADALKGVLACALLPWLADRMTAAGPGPHSEWLVIVAGVGAILGHNYTCWLGFKGGKGIATSAGVLLVLMPQVLGIVFAVWLLAFAATRIVSVASIGAALALPLAAWMLGESPTILGVAITLGALAVYRHRGNIRRLRAGTEPRAGLRSGGPPTSPGRVVQASSLPPRGSWSRGMAAPAKAAPPEPPTRTTP